MKKYAEFFKKLNRAVLITAGTAFLVGLIFFVIPVKTYANSAPPAEAVQTSGTAPASQNNSTGWAFISAALATGLACIGAGFAVSNVGSAAMGAVTERPELLGKSLIYVALAEGIAIYGLLISIIILARI
ncbi:MAG: ATPase [Candidatus Neomarinimicrobiota bacterium]|nr:MAG: ATPase [Candidatus Neomarinimicrobiota bacterium]